LDPLNRYAHTQLGWALYEARRYKEAIATFQEAMALDPEIPDGGRGRSYYALGDYQRARTLCEAKPDLLFDSQICLAMTYHKLGRQADAAAALAKIKPSGGAMGLLKSAEVYAQWGDTAKALELLETALQMHAGMACLKADPLLDPLRAQPRFQAIERQLKFPD
jgi:tetratricopeptide (TPR) repeat protein